MRNLTLSSVLVCLVLAGLSLGCRERRELPDEPITFEIVQPLLLDRCAPCHGEALRAAGVGLESYYDAIGCTSQGTEVAQPADSTAPIIVVLARADHAALLSSTERALLLRWVQAGAPGRTGIVHGPDILDPRSPGWHGRLAREQGFASLRDPAAEVSCGRCHEGAPVRPRGVTSAVPGAPACTSCHQQPAGVLACGTCHGAEDRAYPPRAPCYFGAPAGEDGIDAHRAHVTGTRFRSPPLDCASCHPVPRKDVLAGSHANGVLDLAFTAHGESAARFDAARGTCTVACHARGGQQSEPSWRAQLALDCNACHLSPPRDHYLGACSACHTQMGEGPSELRPGSQHINGVVDLGDGSGTCGACHGQGSDPWPRDSVHRAHRDTQLTAAIACDTCHSVPATVSAPGHLDGRVHVLLAPRTRSEGREPSYDPASKRCSAVACHGGPLQTGPSVEPRWVASSATVACTGCHGAPPRPPHVQQPACGGGLCHGSEVGGSAPTPGITPSGLGLHIDGVVQAGAR